jgi:hypothetical protein
MRIGLGLLFAVSAVMACGEPVSCDPEAASCLGGQSCWWGGDEPGFYCFTPCSGDADCGGGQSCKSAASSCEACDDIRRVCM